VGGDHDGRGPVGDERKDAQEVDPAGRVYAGQGAGVSSESAREIRELKRKNAAELERTIEILKAATRFFVRECDSPRK
jgi:hypothetical protein